MTALYAISDELRAIVDGADGELPEDFDARLNQLEGEFRDKAESIALLCQELRRQAEAAAAEAKRLGELAAHRNNKVESLKEYLRHHMQATGQTSIKTDLVQVRIQRNSRPAINWQRPIEELPDAFRRVAVTLDTSKVYDAYRAGEPLPVGFEVTLGSHLRIQ